MFFDILKSCEGKTLFLDLHLFTFWEKYLQEARKIWMISCYVCPSPYSVQRHIIIIKHTLIQLCCQDRSSLKFNHPLFFLYLFFSFALFVCRKTTWIFSVGSRRPYLNHQSVCSCSGQVIRPQAYTDGGQNGTRGGHSEVLIANMKRLSPLKSRHPSRCRCNYSFVACNVGFISLKQRVQYIYFWKPYIDITRNIHY